mgnify:FL=1
MVIFKRLTMPKENFPKGIIVEVNKNGWSNSEIMKKWIQKIWIKRNDSFFKPKSLLIYDSARCHLTEEVKNEVKKYSELAVIPGGLTKSLQPLDLSVNKSFKSKLKIHWENWIINGCHIYNKTGKIKRATYSEICDWIVKSWEDVTPQCIKNGFKKAGIQTYDENIEGDDDSEIETGSEDKDLQEIQTEFLHIFETFEIIDDEDFDGFEEIE